MLNEMWQVLRALERAGTRLEIPHPLIQPLPVSEKNVLRVRLNDAGCAVTVEDISGEERPGIKRIVKASSGSFPVIKVNQPLLSLAGESGIWGKLGKTKQDKSRIDLLTEAANQGSYRSWGDAGWNWTGSLSKADVLIDKLGSNDHARGLKDVAVRFKKALKSENKFILEVGAAVLKQLRKGGLGSVGTAIELLVGRGKDGANDRKISVLLVLDLDNERSIHQKQVWDFVSEVLPTDLAESRIQSHSAVASAFGGDEALLVGPFPVVTLPVLNAGFPLISMASNADKAKCNKRYGLTEYTVFPVTTNQSRRMAGALEWLVEKGKKGITWQGVASGLFEMDSRRHKKREKRDLLIVYVEEKPELAVKTASYFGSGAEITQAQFDVDSKAVCDALQGIVQVHPKSKLNLFLIRKVSDGQVQIALAESPTVREVLIAAELWQAGAKNIPLVTMYLPEMSRRNETFPAVVDAHPLTPYPDQVVSLLSRQWVRFGASPLGSDGRPQKAAQEIVGPGLADVLSLMLRAEGKWELAAQRMLDLLIRRVGPVLIGLFGAKHAYGPRHAQGEHEPLFNYPRESRETALRAVAVFGILLDAIASRKENFMKEAPFQVGQMLSLADTLHKDYCIVVRKGQLPSSLIGTSLMRRALDSPAGAMADLSERVLEYVRWAKVLKVPETEVEPGTNTEKEESKRRRFPFLQAKKTLARYGLLATTLGDCALPKECNDVMKAQLLLGFLASPPTEEQKDEVKEEIQ